MTINTAGVPLRMLDRKRLLTHLADLSSSEPECRARAALAATDLLHRKGLSWEALISGVVREDAGGDRSSDNWHAEALALLNRSDLTPDERSVLLKLSAWRAPGIEGLKRLRAIAERVGT